MSKRYIFDLDNTLIQTNQLNSDAYNYALNELGFAKIDNFERLTREEIQLVYPTISKQQMSRLIELKQEYFISHIHQTKLNNELNDLLQYYGTNTCILWTRGDKKRVNALLKYYNLEKSFIKIKYSRKDDINLDIKEICQIFNCNDSQLVFFEDSFEIIEELENLNQKILSI